jgi:hypothetical protein
MRRKRLLYIAPLAILGMALFVFIGGQAVQYLWNWLLPSLFGFPAVTFWQALGLLALTRILFGGFGWRGGPRGGMRRRMQERCEAMTPEERERYRDRVRARWGFDPGKGAQEEQGG